ncbi:uncharacterized protein [Cicer arietinum]|uniref:non-specific serine/threonine protein kinase n=1 Tax=Cicer arietinum TaxID=3827 RepID=A0A1S2YZM9_CICAR|nr:probable LRR receptor-like serine/threonine-protein kinase At3g47570 [Cicer arietinum]
MKSFLHMLHAFFLICLYILQLYTLNLLWFGPNKTAYALGNDTDFLALLKFKKSISNDPFGILDSWNGSTHFCKWHGITCMHQRVTELYLAGNQLHGSISPHVGNLTFLTNFNLMNNSFYGTIPQELCSLVKLQQLYLNNNSLVGEIPSNLTSLLNLKSLYLSRNNLVGTIPIEIGSLKKLQRIFIWNNNLTGEIPPTIGNLSFLINFNVGSNNLEGNIPQEICHLKNLETISVGINKLSGKLPLCLYNMSSLTLIAVDLNQFNGSLPPKMFHTLPNLKTLFIGGNQISGLIPTSITNASYLRAFDITQNQFIGHVPSLGKLKDLQLIGLSQNNLGSNSTNDLEFVKSLENCSKLYVIDISYNNFGGLLPNTLGNMSKQLNSIYLGGNHISGKIPAELGNLVNLYLFTVENNRFEGMIPTTFVKVQKLQVLELRGNKLSGSIPAFIGNLSQLFYLGLGHNKLEGNIPPSIGNCQKLYYLDLSQNNLRGTIPIEVFNLFSLTKLLDLSRNALSGSLPQEVGRLENIGMLNFSENHLSGDIPKTIGKCESLEYLHLQGNSFHGVIPTSLVSLKSLQHLDLSRNRLSGSIPKGLQNISFLEYFNVSFNMLEGEVPTEGVFQNASEVVVTGNNNLCGGISKLHLPPCPLKGKKQAKHHYLKLIAVVVSVASFLLILLFILTIYCIKKRNMKPSSDSPRIDLLVKISYEDLHNGTDGFSTRNLIGSGSFGSVYLGTLELDDKVVAVKVLKLQKKGAHKSFMVECNALKNIRHRNLVKILTSCSSTDFKGQEFKALVFEYMRNGSLESWLHPEKEIAGPQKTLNLAQRLNIIIDVASAFHYLHHECDQPVIHCDLKPSNVLLDDSMVAHVSDFGIAKLLPSIGVSLTQNSTVGIKGTIGYAPPEYGMGSKLSIEGDVYSFGILILEILTGRRPTDEMFEDSHSLHNFVKISISSDLLQIVDPTIVHNELEQTIDSENVGAMHSNVEKCLLSLFSIALACSVESPKERMSMVEVMRELNIIKSFFPTEDLMEANLH